MHTHTLKDNPQTRIVQLRTRLITASARILRVCVHFFFVELIFSTKIAKHVQLFVVVG